jgi:hypothetical protein
LNCACNRSTILYAPSGICQLPFTVHSTRQFARCEACGIRRVTATLAIWSYSGCSRIFSTTKATNSAAVFVSMVPYPGLVICDPPRLALSCAPRGCPEFRQLLRLPPVHHQPSPPPEVSRIIEQRHLDRRETEASGFVCDGIHDADQRLALGDVVKSIGQARHPLGAVCRNQMVDLALARTREIEPHIRSPLCCRARARPHVHRAFV